MKGKIMQNITILHLEYNSMIMSIPSLNHAGLLLIYIIPPL